MTIELTTEERDFLVDNALNGLWNHCHDLLQKSNVGDIEKDNLEKCKLKCKELMKKLDPHVFL